MTPNVLPRKMRRKSVFSPFLNEEETCFAHNFIAAQGRDLKFKRVVLYDIKNEI